MTRLTSNPSEKQPPGGKPAPEVDGPRDLISLLVHHGHLSAEQLAYAVRIRSKLETQRIMLDVLKELKLVTDDQIRETILSNLGILPIGGLLVELGLLTKDDLQVGLAVQAQETPRRKLGEVLVAHHFVEEKKLVEVLSMQLGFPFAEPDFAEVDPKLFSRAPVSLYTSHHFIPMGMDGSRVVIAFADPLDLWAMDEVKKFFGDQILPSISTRKSIFRAIVRMRPDVEEGGGARPDPVLAGGCGQRDHRRGHRRRKRQRHPHGAHAGSVPYPLSPGRRAALFQGL